MVYKIHKKILLNMNASAINFLYNFFLILLIFFDQINNY